MRKERFVSPSLRGSIGARFILAVAVLGLLFLPTTGSFRHSTALPGETTAEAAVAAPACTLATVCLTDDVTGDHLSYTCPAGTYTYKRCSNGFTLTGTGVVNTVSGTEMLTDSKPDRRISAGLLTGEGTGRAVIYVIVAPGVIQTLTINQKIPFSTCGTC